MLNFKVIRKVELLEANLEHGGTQWARNSSYLIQARGGHTGHHYYITLYLFNL